MKEIHRAKKLEVAQHYLLGYTYGEIEKEAGVSQLARPATSATIKGLCRGKL